MTDVPNIHLTQFLQAHNSTHFPYTTLFRSLALRLHPLLELAPQIGRKLRVVEHDVLEIGREVDLDRFALGEAAERLGRQRRRDRKSTRLNSSHTVSSYAVFCLIKKKKIKHE